PIPLSSQPSRTHPHLPPFPTRRSSDLPPDRSSVSGGVPHPDDRISAARIPRVVIRDSRFSILGSWFLVLGSDLKGKTRLVNEQRSEEHTSELQSRGHLVCRLLLEKKKK